VVQIPSGIGINSSAFQRETNQNATGLFYTYTYIYQIDI